jgi:hypothetical protein
MVCDALVSADRMLRLPSEGLIRFVLTFGRLQVSYYFANATVSIVKGDKLTWVSRSP